MPLRSRLLSEIFGIEKKEIISITGSGGKTTLLFLLAGELARRGFKAILTTTTHLKKPDVEDLPLIIDEDEETLLGQVRETLHKFPSVLAARSCSPEGKLDGLSGDFIGKLLNLAETDVVLVEADGARMKSLKGYAPHEPVIPSATTQILVVVGLDCVGRPLSEEYVHRPALAAKVLGLQEGELITPESVVHLITSPGGYLERAQPGRVTVILNKVDGFPELQWALEVSHGIAPDPRVTRVVLRGDYLSGGIWDLGKGA
ncbi:MAG: selenium cofactor biosynthesis protein YqeC [bacterium]